MPFEGKDWGRLTGAVQKMRDLAAVGCASIPVLIRGSGDCRPAASRYHSGQVRVPPWWM